MSTFTTDPQNPAGTAHYTGSVIDETSRILGYDVMSIETDPDGQAWFWTATWQEREREADRDIAEGRTRVFESSEEFLRYLDE